MTVLRGSLCPVGSSAASRLQAYTPNQGDCLTGRAQYPTTGVCVLALLYMNSSLCVRRLVVSCAFLCMSGASFYLTLAAFWLMIFVRVSMIRASTLSMIPKDKHHGQQACGTHTSRGSCAHIHRGALGACSVHM